MGAVRTTLSPGSVMRASEVTIDWLKERVEGWEGSGGQYACWCPCHDDYGTSVKGGSITVRPNGKILYKCHSPQCGATLTDVVKVFGDDYEAPEDDAPPVTITSVKGKTGLQWWAEYTQVKAAIWEDLGCYNHGEGIAFHFTDSPVIKTRNPPAHAKDFHFVPRGATASPLWPTPGDDLPEHISITEGESDCGTTYAAGLPMGFSLTKGSDTPLSTETFLALSRRGVQEITFYADSDSPGEKIRAEVTRHAIEANLGVSVCDLTLVTDPFFPYKDINSLWKATDSEQFHELIERATYQVKKSMPFMDVVAMKERRKIERRWIINGLLSPGDKAMIWGPPKAYKTWMTLDLVRALTRQTPFLKRGEWVADKPHKVLLVEEEGNIDGLMERVSRLNLEDDDPFMLIHKQGVAFTNPDSISYLVSICREYEIDVLILDPLQRMIPGVNENDSAETGVVWDEITRMQRLCEDLAVVIVHHANKSDTSGWMSSRGASRHGGEVDLGIEVRKHPVEDHAMSIWMDGRDVYATLGPDGSFKGKITITDDLFEIDAAEMEVNVSKTRTQGDQNEHAVLKAIEEGHETRTQIKMELNLSDPTVIKHLKRLEEKGAIEWSQMGNVKHYKVRPDSAS
jgi:predicted transcriptional regulator